MRPADSASVVEGPPLRVPTPALQRLLAALPYVAAGALLTVVFVDYISGEIRLTPRIYAFSAWLLYELLACAYATILPVGLIVVGVVRALRGLPPKAAGRDGSLLLLLPFAFLAWAIAPDGPGRYWASAAFLALALARWLTHHQQGTMIREGATLLAQAAGRAVWVWAFFTAAFLLSAFVILPLEPLLGLDMPSVDRGQHFMLLGMGVVYFALRSLSVLLDLEQRLFSRRRRLANLLERAPRESGTGKSAA